MKSKVEKAGPCRKVLAITADTEEIKPEYDKILKDIASGVRIPGFRKGKAPIAIVQKRFASVIDQEVQDRMIPLLYRDGLQKEKITPIAVIDVTDIKMDRKDGLSFKVTLDVAPEFKLPRYKKITVKKEEAKITDQEVDESIAKALKSMAKYEDASDREVRKDDYIKIDFDATIDGKSFEEISKDISFLGKARDYSILAGETGLIPGLAEGVIGLKTGEERGITVSFPETHRVKGVAGKIAEYTVKVNSIKEPVLPEMNEDLFKKFGADSEAALREKVKKDLIDQAEIVIKNRQKDEIVKYLLGKTTIDIPQSVVDQEKAGIIRDVIRRSAMQGVSEEDIVAKRDSILDDAGKSATETVKVSYILSRIAEEEKIEVTDDELTEHIAKLSASYSMSKEEFRAELEKNNKIEQLETGIRAEKTLEFLLSNAKMSTGGWW